MPCLPKSRSTTKMHALRIWRLHVSTGDSPAGHSLRSNMDVSVAPVPVRLSQNIPRWGSTRVNPIRTERMTAYSIMFLFSVGQDERPNSSRGQSGAWNLPGGPAGGPTLAKRANERVTLGPAGLDRFFFFGCITACAATPVAVLFLFGPVCID